MLKPILLVEHDPQDLELMLVALERVQVANELIIARDGVEALDYLLRRNAFADRAEGNPAVVLLNLKLPKVSGLEVLEIIRTTPPLLQVPVAMLTSSRMPTDLNLAYALGVNAYVVKPIEFKAFIAAVSRLVLFWTLLNEPPPVSVRTLPRSGQYSAAGITCSAVPLPTAPTSPASPARGVSAMPSRSPPWHLAWWTL